MYDRTKEAFETDMVGLLHSDSYYYLIENELSVEKDKVKSVNYDHEQSLVLIDISRQLAMPLTISTADQLFTAVLKYRGYEKIYATLAYSKVVIDEIQSYDPEIVAIILKGLKDIAYLGGQFCIITATLPPIYQDYLLSIPNTKALNSRILPDAKHKIKLVNDDISAHLSDIVSAYKRTGKVLVIVNTVKKAQALYKDLREYLQDNNDVKIPFDILHSAYIYIDRRRKEKDILDENTKGIWITTQLVEVSLNIDFPVLFTELATIDSLIQRMGRILRFSKGSISAPFIYNEYFHNVNIFTIATGITGKRSIYDQDIVKRSLEYLTKYDGKLLSEEDKQTMVKNIFQKSKLEGTEYLRKYELSLRLLENGLEAENKAEAQALFRKICNITVIPVNIREKYHDEIDEALDRLESGTAERTDRIEALYTLRKYSLSVPSYKMKKKLHVLRGDLFMTTMKYDPDLGLLPDEDCENVL
jgi:CRISPR-associated endonuclease/helicase Cas3